MSRRAHALTCLRVTYVHKHVLATFAFTIVASRQLYPSSVSGLEGYNVASAYLTQAPRIASIPSLSFPSFLFFLS